MAEYPKVIYVYQARSKLTGAVHRSYSDQETSYCEQKAYLRADTCTENERLEELIRRIERVEAHYGKPRGNNPNEDFHQGQATAFGKCVQMLREVLQ